MYIVGRFSSEFVESRRRALEKYLERISKHSELSTSEHYFTFLQTDDATLAKLKEDFKSSKPALSTTAAKWFESKVHSMSAGGKVIKITKSRTQSQLMLSPTTFVRIRKSRNPQQT